MVSSCFITKFGKNTMNLSTFFASPFYCEAWQVGTVGRLSLLLSCLSSSLSVQQDALRSCAVDVAICVGRMRGSFDWFRPHGCYFTAQRIVSLCVSNMFQTFWDSFTCFSLFGPFTTPEIREFTWVHRSAFFVPFASKNLAHPGGKIPAQWGAAYGHISTIE